MSDLYEYGGHIHDEDAYFAGRKARIMDNAMKTFCRTFPRGNEVHSFVCDAVAGHMGVFWEGNQFVVSMFEAFEKYGKLTEKQYNAVVKMIDNKKARDEKFKAERAASRKAAEGKAIELGYIAEPKVRVEIEGTVEAIIKFEGVNWQGVTIEKSIYKIRTEAGHILTHFTDGALPCKADDERWIEKGDRVAGKVTVKANEERDGVPQSIVNRPYLVVL